MKKKRMTVPTIIIALGVITAMAAALLTSIIKTPVVTEQDFSYSATYQFNGELKTLEGVYRCSFSNILSGTNPRERVYTGIYLTNDNEERPSAHTIARQDDLELCIIFTFANNYLMGDGRNMEYEASLGIPYLAVFDKDGNEYSDPEALETFDVSLVEWETPQPIENSFVFGGFSPLHDGSMISMLCVGIITIFACIAFVGRDRSIPYKELDKISIVFNIILGIVAIPFMTLITWLGQITVASDSWTYQLNFCIPAITAFSIAASISLRRKGLTKRGFFIQFLGPVLFTLLL